MATNQAKNPKSPPAKRAARPRRVTLRVSARGVRDQALDLVSRPRFWQAAGVIAGVVLLASVLAVWTREQPLLAIGRVMDETRLVRVEFFVVNTEQTARARERARQEAPRVYSAVPSAFDAIAERLDALRRAAASTTEFDALDRGLRERFALTPERLAVLRAQLGTEEGAAGWDARVEALLAVLRRNPLLPTEEFRRAALVGSAARIELRAAGQSEFVPRDQCVDLGDAAATQSTLRRLVQIARFDGESGEAVLAGLLSNPVPTFALDEAATGASQAAAAAAVPDQNERFTVGTPIFVRGDVLQPGKFDIFARERRAYAAQAPAIERFVSASAVAAVVLGLTAVLTAVMVTSVPGAADPRTALATGVTLLLGQALSAGVAVLEPRFAAVAAVVPVLLTAGVMTIARGRVAGLAVASVAALLIALTIDLPRGPLFVLLLGAWVFAIGLGRVTGRRAVTVATIWTAALLAVAPPTLGMVGRVVNETAFVQALGDGLLVGVAAMVCGSLTLFALPGVERLFGVTTGLKLIELRDPKQPLLREMQRRAPGTYNHSLNVASIAESAAAAVGADTLLTYAGALYHDIGKINKPEYFVENQAGGPNKHDALTPAMSLLIIVGHVKDGLAIARDHALPRPLHHFIEGHHGTTLVEYFFRRAVRRAEAEAGPNADPDEDIGPDETDYRYPGPRPRTKECAILMLADAVESATRTLAEPTPSRIDALVRDLAAKRLADGQFDDCDLTFRELQVIVESISRSVASIYHGRVQYPSDRKPDQPRPAAAAT